MTPYERFINRRYVKIFNHFLKEVVEPAVYDKSYKKIKFKLYGISVRPKSSVYEAIPKEELLDSQAAVSFFIDSEPSNHLENINFIEDLIFLKGRSFLQLQDGDWLGYKSEKFRLGLNFNKRPLYPLNYVSEDPIIENVLPFSQKEKNGIKTRLFKENINSGELKWHFDKQDRKVKVVKSNNWMLQMDNDIPKPLKEGQTIFIPKGVYHRVIKGQGDLIVKIKEL